MVQCVYTILTHNVYIEQQTTFLDLKTPHVCVLYCHLLYYFKHKTPHHTTDTHTVRVYIFLLNSIG